MAKDGSVAPRERVNIVYKPATGNAKEEIELPLKLMMLGDYTLQEDPTPLEDRQTINIDKDNFNEVLQKQNLNLEFGVRDKLREDASEDDQLNVKLKFESMKDFEPESIVNQVPELRQLLELRRALQSLKAPLANSVKFRKKLETLLADDKAREQLMKEIGLAEQEK